MKKIHLPQERKMFSDQQLIDMAKSMKDLEQKIRNMEFQNNTPLEKMIDFQRLTKAFYKNFKYSYGVPLKVKKRPLKEDEQKETNETSFEENKSN